jgi:hypothetical protein
MYHCVRNCGIGALPFTGFPFVRFGLIAMLLVLVGIVLVRRSFGVMQ